MTAIEDKNYFYARQYAYDLLRRLFIEEPSVEFLHFLQKDKNLKKFPHINQSPELKTAISHITNYLKNNEFVAGEEGFENLHWDFTRLFIGPEAPPAPPWESVYVSKDKLLFQENTNAVKQFYKDAGFQLEHGEHEAADHIGFELDFMYHLSSVTIEEFKNNELLDILLDVQNQFLQKHLLMFSDLFARNVIEHADTAFYRAAAVMLQNFLKHDQQCIESVQKKKNLPRWQ